MATGKVIVEVAAPVGEREMALKAVATEVVAMVAVRVEARMASAEGRTVGAEEAEAPVEVAMEVAR